MGKESIILIGGTLGSGRTTQTRSLRTVLKERGYTLGVGALIVKEDEYDIARKIAIQSINKNSFKDVLDVLKEDISYLEALQRKSLNFRYVVLVMEDFEECNKRKEKNAKLLDLFEYTQINEEQEKQVANFLNKIRANLASKQIKFTLVNIHKEDKILEITDHIINELEFLNDLS